MTAIPTTPTATDKLEEVRKLNIEIAALNRVRDLARTVSGDAEKAVTEATKRAKEAEAHLATLEASMAGAGAEIGEFVAYCRGVLQAATDAMQELAKFAKEMDRRVGELVTAITESEAKLEELRKAFAKENETMSEKRLDLDIYHKRIVEAAEKHLPGQKVVI